MVVSIVRYSCPIKSLLQPAATEFFVAIASGVFKCRRRAIFNPREHFILSEVSNHFLTIRACITECMGGCLRTDTQYLVLHHCREAISMLGLKWRPSKFSPIHSHLTPD